MKKITTLFFLFLLLFLFANKEQTELVFEEKNYVETDHAYSYYNLTFQDKNLTTKNFINYFEDITVLSIKPYINDIYKDKIRNPFEIYTFTSGTLNDNIVLFESLYKENLRDNGISKDLAKVDIYGIPINEVKILCDENSLEKLKPLKYILNQ